MKIEKQVELYDLFLSAINSENSDYILRNLSKIYTKILEEIGDTKEKILIPYSFIRDNIDLVSLEIIDIKTFKKRIESYKNEVCCDNSQEYEREIPLF